MRRLVILALVFLAGVATADEIPPYRASDWPFRDPEPDCRNTRTKVLIRHAVPTKDALDPADQAEWIALELDAEGCTVQTGTWVSAYTGRLVTNPALLDIEHVVSRHEAHEAGGARWSRAEKIAFANDPVVLVVVEASVNRARGDRGPEAWSEWVKLLSPQGRCFIVHRRALIKQLYRLTSTAAERAAVRALVATC